jgi:tetratricopeptide (TPR) repeat protein
MKLLINTVLVLSVALTACAPKPENNDKKDLEKHLRIYETAKEQFDYTTAAAALNYALDLDSGNIAMIDSLSRIYFSMGNLEAGIATAEVVLSDRKDNRLKELIGLGYQRQGENAKAIQVFNELHQDLKDDKYLYQVAVLHLEQGNLDASDSTITHLLQNGNESTMIDNKGANGQTEIVPLFAACHNLRGIILAEAKGDIAGASKEFKKALKYAPDFSIPSAYLQQIAEYQRMRYGRR